MQEPFKTITVRFLIGFTGLWAVNWLLHTGLLAMGAGEAFARLVVTAAYWIAQVGLLQHVLVQGVARGEVTVMRGRDRVAPRGFALRELIRGYLWRALVLIALTQGLFLGLRTEFHADTLVLSIIGDFAVAGFALCWLLERPLGRIRITAVGDTPQRGRRQERAGRGLAGATSAAAVRPAAFRP